MDFNIIEFKRISKFITIRQLETHQSDRNKEIEPESHTVELRLYIQRFVIELSILSKDIKKRLVADEIPIFQTSVIIKVGGEEFSLNPRMEFQPPKRYNSFAENSTLESIMAPSALIFRKWFPEIL
jgi:hypothetical protein